jgi:hypothetical protein
MTLTSREMASRPSQTEELFDLIDSVIAASRVCTDRGAKRECPVVPSEEYAETCMEQLASAVDAGRKAYLAAA